MEKTYLVNFHN